MNPEKPKRASWVGHGLEPQSQIHEKKRQHMRREKGKTKRNILGPPPIGAPASPIWAPHPKWTAPKSMDWPKMAKIGPAKNGLSSSLVPGQAVPNNGRGSVGLGREGTEGLFF